MSDEESSPRRDRPEFPLIFEPAKPSLTERMLSPLRELFRSESDEEDRARAPEGAPEGPGDASREADAPEAGPAGPSAAAVRGGRTTGPSSGARSGAAAGGGPERGASSEDAGTTAGDMDAVGPVQRATIQLLPGRLQPLDTEIVRQEVRFLRSGGRESVVTLGWEVGEPPGHVTLDHPSILPRHARMRFRDGEWTIESLSDEDPVEVNGEVLGEGDWPRLLRSGDHVRIGEAVFRFHQP